MRYPLFGFVVLLSVAFSGCGPSSKLIGSWTDSSAAKVVTGRMLVIGVACSQTHRRIFEDSLVANLQAAGVDAVPSYKVSPDEIKEDEEAIRAVTAQAGAATVMVTHVVASDEENRYFPAIGATFIDDGGYYGGLYRYYPRVYHYVYMPAQNQSKATVTLETGLYSAADGRLLWIGRSEAVNPEMTRRYYTSLTKLFVEELQKKKLI